jgi:hypothetical protein
MSLPRGHTFRYSALVLKVFVKTKNLQLKTYDCILYRAHPGEPPAFRN